jgi:hypothetical protein
MVNASMHLRLATRHTATIFLALLEVLGDHTDKLNSIPRPVTPATVVVLQPEARCRSLMPLAWR